MDEPEVHRRGRGRSSPSTEPSSLEDLDRVCWSRSARHGPHGEESRCRPAPSVVSSCSAGSPLIGFLSALGGQQLLSRDAPTPSASTNATATTERVSSPSSEPSVAPSVAAVPDRAARDRSVPDRRAADEPTRRRAGAERDLVERGPGGAVHRGTCERGRLRP